MSNNSNVHNISNQRVRTLSIEEKIIATLTAHLSDQKKLSELMQITKQYITLEHFNPTIEAVTYMVLMDMHNNKTLTPDILADCVADQLKNENDNSLKVIKSHVRNLAKHEIALPESDTRKLENLCKELKERYNQKRTTEILDNALKESIKPGVKLDDLTRDTINEMSSLKFGGVSNTQSLEDVHDDLLNELYNDMVAETCIDTGIKAMDNCINGIPRKSISCLLGDTGHGKTTLAIQIATNVAKNYPNGDVLYISLEMSSLELHCKIITYLSEGKINGIRMLKQGNLNNDQKTELHKYSSQAKDLPFYIIDTTETNSVEDIINEINAHIAKYDRHINLIILDHWHLLNFYQRGITYTEAQNQAITRLNNYIKRIDSRLLILTQRDKASRVSKGRPKMDDVKGTSGLSDIAQNFIVIHRPEFGAGEEIETAMVYIDKARHGQTHTKINR